MQGKLGVGHGGQGMEPIWMYIWEVHGEKKIRRKKVCLNKFLSMAVGFYFFVNGKWEK